MYDEIGETPNNYCETIDEQRKNINIQQFRLDLCRIINRHSLDCRSNTPDFILADYLVDCLLSYEKIHEKNEKWYGKKLEVGCCDGTLGE
jgi:hypothetical protein